MSDETHPDRGISGQPYSAPSELHFKPGHEPAVGETFTVLPPDYQPEPPAVQPEPPSVPPTQAWGGNADPRNLSYRAYDGARFGPGYEHLDYVPWDGRPPQSYLPPPQPTTGQGGEGLVSDELVERAARWLAFGYDDGGKPGFRDDWNIRDDYAPLWMLKLGEARRALSAVAPDIAAQARADGIEEGCGDMEHLERKWRAEERERGAPARYAAYEALVHAERRCRYHDPIGDKLGSERGLPRCESCQQPYRVNAALDAIDRYTRDTSGPADEG